MAKISYDAVLIHLKDEDLKKKLDHIYSNFKEGKINFADFSMKASFVQREQEGRLRSESRRMRSQAISARIRLCVGGLHGREPESPKG